MENILESVGSKKPVTDEEREKLARRLDEDLDNFIDNLQKTPYKDGWKEETWREEMEKHPFFMTKPPEPEDEPSPLVEGLQNLRYDPDDNTPEELAAKHKDDGNFNFKCRKYKLAIMSYQEGLKLDFQNNELRAQMFNNMSASHYFLKNFRSSLTAAEQALKLKADYEKTIFRAINCCIQLKEFDKCLDFCDKYLELVPEDNNIIKIKKEAIKSKKIMEMEKRKVTKIQKQKEADQARLLFELNKRQLNIIGINDGPIKELAILDPRVPGLIQPVHLVENRLVWPVVFLYPEYKTSDMIQEFYEDSTFYIHLIEMFSERPEWDIDGKYNADVVNVYFEIVNEHKADTKVTKIDAKSCTLFEALTLLRCPIDNGTPVFLIFIAGSQFEKKFLAEVP
ncbi:tetratricopeptide repeat protein 4 [Acyrthosiphon pisum]|uniref:Cns1/TTC4 wheel domain-containing protein n=1 Tax=Acyrthosiphon pisum TaxID=7029 RepID=A0A8R2A9F1_ACYPI|nr:tetratricopeptide repeat protein 4 [Acyrthosiphon pisum]|eukprot:XP_003241653.1 PREDICTED: tetratricopeptide repeat protein 4 [Acyrthosiphon pisum]